MRIAVNFWHAERLVNLPSWTHVNMGPGRQFHGTFGYASSCPDVLQFHAIIPQTQTIHPSPNSYRSNIDFCSRSPTLR